MILKFACWPVFFIGFLLSVVNAEIPYIPTAKKASIGSISTFARPLYVQVFLFVIAVVSIAIHRRFQMTEYDLLETREGMWSMLSFASVSFIMSTIGIYAASESKRMKVEDCWDFVDLNQIKTESTTNSKKK
jgi:cellulose synthase (UDP-forming)